MTASTLVVAVRGWTTTGELLLFGRPGGELGQEFSQALQQDLTDSEVWAPDLDLSMFSMRDAESLACELFDKIDKKVAAMPALSSIVLVGYSSGSLLVRRVFCMAHGARPDGSLTNTPASWADKIDRVVVLSGITRGWEFSSATPAYMRFFAPVLHAIAWGVGQFKKQSGGSYSNTPFLWQLKRGAPFVVATRIQYVEVFKQLRANKLSHKEASLRAKGVPSTVFIVGAKDELISPADCTELGPRSEFAFIELAGSNHMQAIQIAGAGGAERRKRLVAAIVEAFDPLTRNEWAVPATAINEYLDPMDLTDKSATRGSRRAKVEHAVIVMHGIRDNGFWTKRVAREVKAVADKHGLSVRAPTPSYGFFSMWDFVRPYHRKEATYWFMERYADVRSQFPNAKISFVGHSNGTFLAAHALELCPAIRFENMVLAGSVVRCRFDWSKVAGQVKGKVLNYVGTADTVVAFLPAVMESIWMFRWLGVGGAGAFGFDQARNANCPVPIHQVICVSGGHGAAVAEGFWPEIADFALSRTTPVRTAVLRPRRLQMLFRCAPFLSPIAALAIAACIIAPFRRALMVVVDGVGTSSSLVVPEMLGWAGLGIALVWLANRVLREW